MYQTSRSVGEMGSILMKLYLINPLFIMGLLLKSLIVLFVLPAPVIDWYLPFIENSFSLDPWGTWMANGGNARAFPYGYIMLMCFIPLVNLFGLFGLPTFVGYGATLILADIGLLYFLNKITKTTRINLLLAVYWLSPIIIVATYILGFNDLIPVFLLVCALYFAKENRFFMSGVLCITAVSTKFSMILAMPFFIIYLLHNKTIFHFTKDYLKGVLAATAVLLLPFTLFSGGISMVLENPELDKVYRLLFNLDEDLSIYLVPLIYLLTLYIVWCVRRLNFELFNSILGLSFLSVVLMTPASPGWLIWAMPGLVFYQLSSDKTAVCLVGVLSLLFVANSLAIPIFGYIGSFDLFVEYLHNQKRLLSLLQTFIISTGIILTLRIWRETITRNDFFRLSRKPFIIGIAGDSGAGKDTFSDAIKGLFGYHSVATLSGDNYHIWDRQKPMWQVMTHLNPMANDLERFTRDLIDLKDRKSIQIRHYDHSTGQMSRPFKVISNDFIIVDGLHALYTPILRDCYDLSVYLDIDEELRRHFKKQRDVLQRGHTVEKVLSAFERREEDSKKFIRPQAQNADLIMSLQPIHPRMLDDLKEKDSLRFKLTVRSRKGFDELTLTRVLVGICGLHVDINNDISEVSMTIEGENKADDIALAAKMAYPRLFDFLDTEVKWEDGITGLMQLITLSHIHQALSKRFVS